MSIFFSHHGLGEVLDKLLQRGALQDFEDCVLHLLLIIHVITLMTAELVLCHHLRGGISINCVTSHPNTLAILNHWTWNNKPQRQIENRYKMKYFLYSSVKTQCHNMAGWNVYFLFYYQLTCRADGNAFTTISPHDRQVRCYFRFEYPDWQNCKTAAMAFIWHLSQTDRFQKALQSTSAICGD